MKRSTSARPLFKAISGRRTHENQMNLMPDLPEQEPPAAAKDERDPLDYDPTPADATRAFMAAEGARIRELSPVIWESAIGGGHMARVFLELGFDVIGTDIVNRGFPGTYVTDFREIEYALAPVMVTNPPYNLINSNAAGFWLEHTMALGVRYAAFLLSWNWPQPASLNGLLDRFPPSRVYLCDWKIDFRGMGNPPNCSGWFVWDLDGPDPRAWRTIKLSRGDTRQESLL